MARQGAGDIEEVRSSSAEDSDELVAWCSSIEEKIRQQADGVEHSIPPYLRKLDAVKNDMHPSIFRLRGQSYAITIATIGPYHRSAPAQPIITERKKSGIVMYLARRHSLDTRRFLGWARGIEERIRRCYEKESFVMAAEEFAEMLLLDGCLVVMAIFFLRSGKHRDRRPAHLAKTDPHRKEFLRVSVDISLHMKQLRLELLMLGNQIPFFVVAELYSQLKDSLFLGIDQRIEEMALSCFDDILPWCSQHAQATSALPETKTIHHLLHLFHWSRIPRSKYEVQISSFVPREPKALLPSATELMESATHLRRSPSGSPIDVSFHRSRLGMWGTVSVPALYICDYNEAIFRSLIAFEQSHIRCGLSVTAYCICMSRLLQIEDDAKLLRKNRILGHTQKTDREVVDFFKRLSDEYENTCLPKDLLKLFKDVARHHNSRRGRFCGGIILHYCPNPWITLSVFCGLLLFLVTIANNIHSVYRYYKPVRH